MIQLLPPLYAAPQEGWSGFLEGLRIHFGARQAILSLVDLKVSPTPRSVLHHVGISAEDEAEFRNKWAMSDPWMNRAPLDVPVGHAAPSHELCPDEELEATEVYQQFLGQRGWHYGAGVRIASEAGMLGVLSFARPKNRGPVSPTEMAQLKELQPHVTSVVYLDLRLKRLSFLASHTSRLPYGHALLDEQGQVVHSNALADAMLQSLPPGPLKSSYLPKQHCWMIVQRLDGPPPGSELFFLKPSEDWSIDQVRLREIFGLTQAEARFAALMCQGRTLTECAKEAKISVETARTHMKRILAKTHCRRQAELVGLVLRLVTT